MKELPRLLEANLSLERVGWIQEKVSIILTSDLVIFAGIGSDLGSSEEGALKLIEMAKMPAFAYGTEELMHGRFEGIGKKDCLVVLFPADSEGRKRSEDLVRIAKKIGLNCIEIDLYNPKDFTPTTPSYILSILNVHICQMLSYYSAERRGINPNQPKGPRLQYLTKIDG